MPSPHDYTTTFGPPLCDMNPIGVPHYRPVNPPALSSPLESPLGIFFCNPHRRRGSDENGPQHDFFFGQAADAVPEVSAFFKFLLLN